MDTRSLIKFGKNSYAVTLPQNWIRKEGLTKGDSLYLEENPDGLVFSANSKIKKIPIKKITTDITGKDISRIKRELISHYINGYDVIKIIGKDLMKKSKEIREAMHSLVALEILEQTSKQITSRVFLLSKDTFIPQLIRKVDIINRHMMEDLIKESADYEDIFQRDKDVDRLTFLILRIAKSSIEDSSSNKRGKYSNSELLYYWSIAHILESIADRVRNLALVLSDVRKNKTAFLDIIKLYEEVFITYKGVMDAYYSNNIEKAYKLSMVKHKVVEHCDELYEKHFSKKGVVRALERIRAIAFFVHNICKRTYS